MSNPASSRIAAAVTKREERDKRPVSRIVYWLILLPLFLVVIVFAIDNSDAVDISVWPLMDEKIAMPVHILVLIGLFIGFIFGGLVAWMQGGGTRRRLRQFSRRALADEREIDRLKSRLAEIETPPALPARSGG
jgi:uncharacterized integral membrane protein